MFYVTLPSNTKSSQDNKTNDFLIELSKPLNLDGVWEVGLAEISYPFSWNTLGVSKKAQDRNMVFKKGAVARGFNIPPGHYDSPQELVDMINQFLPWKSREFMFLYDKRTKRVILNIPEEIRLLYMGRELMYILGFDFPKPNVPNGSINSSAFRAPHALDITGGISHLWIYSDLVQPQIVGDQMADLLATVSIKGGGAAFGSMISERFERPHFVPSLTTCINSIKIRIKLHNGRLFPFQFGYVLLKLCFRKKVTRF